MNPLADPLFQQTLTGVFRLVAPEIALIGTACVIFLFGSFINRRGPWCTVALLGIGLAMILAATVKTTQPTFVTIATVNPDAIGQFIRWAALGATLVLLLMSWPEVSDTIASEYYGCLLIIGAGASLVGRANDLILLFLALELISIPTYVLLYLPSRSTWSQEAAAKYFLLSVLSSAFLLFGFSYLYGLTGSTNIASIIETVTKANAEIVSPLSLIAIVLVVAGVGFRIAAVPFHFYAPDVYQGGPTGVVALLSVIPKVAGLAALARLLGVVGADAMRIPFGANSQLPMLIWILALITMTLGNAMALLQENLRRMLAYSSIAHSGYLLMGIVVATSLPDAVGNPRVSPAGTRIGVIAPSIGGIDAMLVYLVAYGIMTLGAFSVILLLSTSERPVERIDDLAGAGQSHPVSAAAMAVFLFSLIGMPLTVGFAGKLMLFLGAFTAPGDSGSMRNLYKVMAVIAAVNAAVGAYYYLRVVGVMYLRAPLRPLSNSRSLPTRIVTFALAAATLVLGIYPQPLAEAARRAAPVPPIVAKPPTEQR